MFLLADSRRAADIIVDPQNPEAVRLVAEAFAEDIQRVTASRPHVITRLDPHTSSNAVVVGVLHHSPTLDQLVTAKCIDPAAIERRWESAIIQVVSVCGKHSHPILVVAGSDRRGAAFALFSPFASNRCFAMELVGRCSGRAPLCHLRRARALRAE